jgi:prevent-host-death family protein
MSTITLEDAQARLAELIGRLRPGEEITVTRDEKPVARIVGAAVPERPAPRFGTLSGTVLAMAPDFDAPLEDFKDYME